MCGTFVIDNAAFWSVRRTSHAGLRSLKPVRAGMRVREERSQTA
jgi:hypothetical protein